MVPAGSTAIKTFADLFASRRQIGYFADDPSVIDLAKKLATANNIDPSQLKMVKLQTDDEAIQVLAKDHNADIVLGDSLHLLPLVQANPQFVQLTDAQYGTPKPISFAVPRNDADFRTLIEVTLQDMERDGTYQKLYQANFAGGTPLNFIIWPGSSTLFGVKTSG
jgi:ABC-type amino acid transport substrate-binding protein